MMLIVYVYMSFRPIRTFRKTQNWDRENRSLSDASSVACGLLLRHFVEEEQQKFTAVPTFTPVDEYPSVPVFRRAG
jgi:hypothetical protein